MTGWKRGANGPPVPAEAPQQTAEELLPLKALRFPLELARDAIYPRMTLMLIRAMEEAFQEACRAALLEEMTPRIRQDIALSARAGFQWDMMLSGMLTRNVTDGETCLLWFALSMETACAMTLRMEENPARRVLRFLLPEYQDALYRLANLYSLQTGQSAQTLLGPSMEIAPGRPLIHCCRPPWDGVCAPWQDAGLWDEMALLALSAVASQSRLACIQAAARARDRLSRELFQETALLCQQHDMLLSSLLPWRAPLNRLRTQAYLTAFLYRSCGLDETLPGPVRSFAMNGEKYALIRLRRAAELSREADPSALELPPFPEPLLLRPCKGVMREALRNAEQTMRNGRIIAFDRAEQAEQRRYRETFCPDESQMPSQRVIRKMIGEKGEDIRSETARHPIEQMRERPRERFAYS